MWCASKGTTPSGAGEQSICKRGSDETIIRASPVGQPLYFGCDEARLSDVAVARRRANLEGVAE